MNRTVGAAIVATIIVGSGGTALAQDKAKRRGNPVVIENPAWVVPPQVDGDDYPIFAAYLGLNGSVSIECLITPQGSPENCLVRDERPTGLGFGEAAKRIVLRHRLTPRRVNGVAAPARFVVRLPFTADYAEPEDAAAPPTMPWNGPEPSAAQIANARDVIEAVGIRLSHSAWDWVNYRKAVESPSWRGPQSCFHPMQNSLSPSRLAWLDYGPRKPSIASSWEQKRLRSQKQRSAQLTQGRTSPPSTPK